MKRILIGTMAVMMTVPCFAAGENVLTSKPYVDDAVSTRQDKIPAANPSNTNLGETVMTYTGTEGEIGERELFTGGTYDAANDADKLITASALKSAFTLPETQTTKLVCANPGTCDLWTITEQTAYGITPFNPDVSIDGTSRCCRGLSGSSNSDMQCGTDTLSYLGETGNKSGKWGAVFPYGDVSGKSVCSAVSASGAGTIATDAQAATMDAEYTAQAGVGESALATNQIYCWCKMENPAASPWVFAMSRNNSSVCASNCALLCSARIASSVVLRRGLFGIE